MPQDKKITRIKSVYYKLKPLIPRRLQIFLRRSVISLKKDKYKEIWPIYDDARHAPKGWRGWPEKKRFALLLTHDVDTIRGQERCLDLMNLEKRLGFRSAMFFVPDIFQSTTILDELKQNGFEVGVHGLLHDGKLYHSREIFQQRAALINYYISKWEAEGFRSPCMHHNLAWLHDLNILYDASTFDVDPFEPQPDGVATIFPFIVMNELSGTSYVELPYTLPQDFTLFILMKQRNNDIWKKKLDWIAENGGMVLFITHPDYMNFGKNKLSLEEYPVEYYSDFLSYIKDKYNNRYWHVLPKDMTRFWAGQMNNTIDDKKWLLPNNLNDSIV
jgi:hypothetical protein